MDNEIGRRLHVGGREPRAGWEILNILPGPGVDHVGDAVDLSRFADGTFAATTVSTVCFVPTNAVRVEVLLGLTGVTGTAWFDDVRLEPVDH